MEPPVFYDIQLFYGEIKSYAQIIELVYCHCLGYCKHINVLQVTFQDFFYCPARQSESVQVNCFVETNLNDGYKGMNNIPTL